jgi:hypothetical protein
MAAFMKERIHLRMKRRYEKDILKKFSLVLPFSSKMEWNKNLTFLLDCFNFSTNFIFAIPSIINFVKQMKGRN